MKRKTFIFRLSAILFVFLALFVSYRVAQRQILYHFAVVDNGRVYRSGTLSYLGLRWAKARSGFKTIINVRSEKENRQSWHQVEADFAKANNVKLIDMPMTNDKPPSSAQIDQFLGIVRNPGNLPVIVHCHQGVTRTAMLVAVYEIAVMGKKNEDVFNTMPMFGHSFEKPKKKAVKDFILNYAPPLKLWGDGDRDIK